MIFFLHYLFFSLEKVIDWLLDEGEIEKTYHFLSDNCQDFAQRLFETLAKTEKYPSWVRTASTIWTSMKEHSSADSAMEVSNNGNVASEVRSSADHGEIEPIDQGTGSVTPNETHSP